MADAQNKFNKYKIDFDLLGDTDEQESNYDFVPVLPMRDIMVFPQMLSPVFFSGNRAKVAIENALLTKDHKIILLAKKKPDIESDVEKEELDNLYKVGILAKVVQIIKYPDGAIKALVEGISRVKASMLEFNNDIIKCHYKKLKDKVEESDSLKALISLTNSQFNEYIKKSTKINVDNFVSLSDVKEPGRIADIIAVYLSIEISEKQNIVEALDVYSRFELISKYLSKEIELLDIEESIQEKVKYNVGKSQKEYLLREKLNAIKQELEGAEGSDEIGELRLKIKNSKIPKQVKEHLYKEVAKLERMSFLTAETAVVKTYIDTVLELPWSKRTKDVLNIDNSRKILDEDHYGLQDAKERILEFLAVKQLTKEPQSNIICFVGPPGVGKTSLAKSIARALNRKFAQVSLGGINDESEIRGHRRTYVGAMPGKIIRAIQDAGTKNPLILLDEIEKMVPSHMGDPTAAMLEVLDPAQNYHYTDHYIDLPYDLSEVFFITTANSIERLYKPLKDRMEVIYLPGYTEEEKKNIADKYLIPRQYKQNGVSFNDLKIKQAALKRIINDYTREAGVRELERSIAKLCRKFALKLVLEPYSKAEIAASDLQEYIGTPRFVREETEKKPQVGLAHGLAWTEVGGELLDIEATIMPGSGKLSLTGRLGEIMQESAQTAFSYIRSNYIKLQLPNNIQKMYDMHIHATDGATPKDGPSAGIALSIALISALTKRPVKEDVAMTGEITLRGRILPIGGLKEKSIAALRSHMKTIIIPKGNEKDIIDIPDYVKDRIEYKSVSCLDQVIDFILLEQTKESSNGKHKGKVSLPKSVLS